MGSPVVLGGALAALVVVAAAVAVVCRPRFAKDPRAAASFIAPGGAVLVAAAVLAALGAGLLAIPAVAVGSLCIAAGAIFLPTRASRFRDFERRFWEHVLHHEQRVRN